MRRAQEIEKAFASGSVRAFEITLVGEGQGFVEEHPIGNAVAQRARDDLYVVGKARSRIAIRPASGIFQSLRQIPVVERDKGTDSGFQQRIDEAAVVVDAFGICQAGPGGLNARPGNREAVAVQVHRSQQRHVFATAMIGVAGYVAGVAILDFAGSMGEAVPDGFAFAVFFPRAFDLVGGGGCAPEETWGTRSRKENQIAGMGSSGRSRRVRGARRIRQSCSRKTNWLAARLRCRRQERSAQIRGGSGAKWNAAPAIAFEHGQDILNRNGEAGALKAILRVYAFGSAC